MEQKLSLKRVKYNNEDLGRLFEELDSELSKLYSEDEIFGLSVKKKPKNSDRIYFLMAYLNKKPVGCGCIRPLNRYWGELKRMFVKPGFRRQGIAKQICEKLEKEAKKQEYNKLFIETGPLQPEAINLYKKTGFVEASPFGKYKPNKSSVFFVKEL